MIRAAFFDMDGVLFDSMPDHAIAWAQAMGEHHLPFTPEDAYLNEGRTGYSVINELMESQFGRPATEAEMRDIYARKSEIFRERNKTRPIPQVAEVLNFLQSHGIVICLVTGSGQKSLLTRLDQFFPGIFVQERMITAADVVKGKPDPEPYLKAFDKASRLLPDLRKSECIVVENAPLGVRAGVAAGCPVWAVNTGPLADEVLACEGAEQVFHSMQEVLEKIGCCF